jgi:hypothetical protein
MVQTFDPESVTASVDYRIKSGCSTADFTKRSENRPTVKDQIRNVVVLHDPPRQCPRLTVKFQANHGIIRPHVRGLIEANPLRIRKRITKMGQFPARVARTLHPQGASLARVPE